MHCGVGLHALHTRATRRISSDPRTPRSCLHFLHDGATPLSTLDIRWIRRTCPQLNSRAIACPDETSRRNAGRAFDGIEHRSQIDLSDVRDVRHDASSTRQSPHSHSIYKLFVRYGLRVAKTEVGKVTRVTSHDSIPRARRTERDAGGTSIQRCEFKIKFKLLKVVRSWCTWGKN